MNEKEGDAWPDEPADENISADPPSQFDRDESDYEPGLAPPRRRMEGDRTRERGETRRNG